MKQYSGNLSSDIKGYTAIMRYFLLSKQVALGITCRNETVIFYLPPCYLQKIRNWQYQWGQCEHSVGPALWLSDPTLKGWLHSLHRPSVSGRLYTDILSATQSVRRKGNILAIFNRDYFFLALCPPWLTDKCRKFASCQKSIKKRIKITSYRMILNNHWQCTNAVCLYKLDSIPIMTYKVRVCGGDS